MNDSRTENRKSLTNALIFVITGIVINLAGANIATALNLPLYLDSIGTILISALGGYLPGVFVGFMSNVINGIRDPMNMYYAVLNVLMALMTALLAGRGFFRKWYYILLMVLPYSLIGGGLGSLITFALYGLNFGEGFTRPLALKFYEHFGSIFWSQLCADLLFDMLDKLVTLIIVAVILRIAEKYYKDDLRLHYWKQKPLSREELSEVTKNHSRTISLRARLMMIISGIVIIIAAVTSVISYRLYKNAMISEYTQTGIGVAKLVSAVVDGDKIDDYIEQGYLEDEYSDIMKELYSVRETSDKILYVYVYKIQPDGCHVVFDLDTEDVPGGKPGDIVEFDMAFEPYMDELFAGEEIPTVVSDETYGWLLTAYEPIRDSFGKTQAYACVDISMDEIRFNQISYLTKIITLFFGFFIAILTFGLWLAEYFLILPINTMTYAAGRFAYKSEEDRQDSVNNFNSMNISTGDEVENLYDSFKMTIDETVQYIADIQKQGKVIENMQNGLILVLADMVESRDQCTGDHVRKTAAYCRIILDQLRKDGEFKDILTDAFIDDVVNSAPLHDIGKIKVPDAILNKPGKLTDEEFAIMKTHTLAGEEIIDQAIELVATDSSYLKEAKNLATYHHEKYNGTGYPTGISGEDIPLSARVMAVADVFDALVSRRSYKEPFSFEKALSIITEGAGTHFDPKVAKAFEEVKDEAQRIMESNLGNLSSDELRDFS